VGAASGTEGLKANVPYPQRTVESVNNGLECSDVAGVCFGSSVQGPMYKKFQML